MEPQIPPQMPMAPGAEMVGPEKKQELLDLIGKTRGSMSAFRTSRFVSEHKQKQSRSEALHSFFDALQKSGVNVNDPAAISQFLQKLRDTNPDMAEMFEQAVEILLAEGDIPSEASGEIPQNTMNLENETVPEDIRGRTPPPTN